MRILIAEDEPKVAQALKQGLEREGYGVSLAATGAEADRRVPIRLPE